MSLGGRVSALVLAAALLTVTGCGGPSAAGPAPTPYDGPLWVEPAKGVDLWDDPGAAGRVVDCDYPVVGSTTASPFTGGEVGDTPESAVQEAHDEGSWDGLDEMQVVRTEPDRVLFAYAAEGRIRQAVIARYGPAAEGTGAGEDGVAWWVESWARCDIAEYPERVAESRNTEIWTDTSGRRLPITTVVSKPGGDCLPGATFLELGIPGADRHNADSREVYVGGAVNHHENWFAEPYQSDATLPADAVDTGYQREGRHLWRSPDHQRAFLVRDDRVELWPRTIQELACG